MCCKESAADTSVYDAISQVAELEEKVFVELQVNVSLFSIFHILPGSFKYFIVFQRASELVVGMQQISYNIETGLPDLMDHSHKLMGL